MLSNKPQDTNDYIRILDVSLSSLNNYSTPCTFDMTKYDYKFVIDGSVPAGQGDDLIMIVNNNWSNLYRGLVSSFYTGTTAITSAVYTATQIALGSIHDTHGHSEFLMTARTSARNVVVIEGNSSSISGTTGYRRFYTGIMNASELSFDSSQFYLTFVLKAGQTFASGRLQIFRFGGGVS